MKLCEIIYENECSMSEKDKIKEIKNITVKQSEIGDGTLMFILNDKYLYDCIGSTRHPSGILKLPICG